MQKYLRLFLLVLLWWVVADLSAQFPGNTGGNRSSSNQPPSEQEEFVELVDTFGIFYFFANNPNEELAFEDSLLTGFEIYETVRKRDMEYADLGNPGSPHQPLFFQPSFRKGVDIGLHQFDLYHLNRDNSPFYRLQNPLSRAAYSQNNNTNLSFNGEYSRNFSGGLSTAVTTIRTNHLGQYQFQRARNTAFANNWWYHDKNGKYDAFLIINSNSNLHVDNGGIDTASLAGPYTNPVTIPVFLGNNIAETRHTHREISYTHYYKLIGAVKTKTPEPKPDFRPNLRGRNRRDSLNNKPVLPDSIQQAPIGVDSLSRGFGEVITMNGDTIGGQVTEFVPPPPPLIGEEPVVPKRAVTLGHAFSYKSSRYRASNTAPDTSFYNDKFLTLDNGLRQYFRHRKIENDFKISTFKLKDDHQKIRRQRDLLEVGLTHTLHLIEQSPEKNTYNNLFLHGQFNYNPGERLRFESYMHYGFLRNLGDYRVQGKLKYSLPKVGALEVELIQQAYEPSLIAERLYISESLVWENDFKKIFETNLKATYRLPQFKLEISGQYHLINNYLYYDTEMTPQQTGTAINVGQLMLKKDFKLGPIHLDNTIILQQTSNNLLRLPRVFTKQSLYFQGYLFKKSMFTHVGVDFRMTDDFQANTYFALTGQFHLQDDWISKAYPLLDVFINFKVQQFRFFAKYENITKLWEPDLYVITPGYPQRFNAFRFGVSWRFLN